MNHGSLESGIGMFDYAAEMMGWENVFHCEKEDFCQTILKYYWPKAKSYANVFGFNGYEWRGKVDIITAGFPCQPFSNAGKRKGSEDDRHIWPENMRIFRGAQPTFIVCENVPGIVTIEDGMVFEQVCLDLENEGYEVQTFIIPAVATDKDHRRDRIWIVAYNQGLRRDCEAQTKYGKEEVGEWRRRGFIDSIDDAPNNTGQRLQSSGQTGIREFQEETRTRLHNRLEQCDRNDTDNESFHKWDARLQEKQYKRLSKQNRGFHSNISTGHRETWLEAATRLCTLDDGSAGRLDTTAISKSKWRKESLKAAGNTIVWEIAYEIFKTIEETILKLSPREF